MSHHGMLIPHEGEDNKNETDNSFVDKNNAGQ